MPVLWIGTGERVSAIVDMRHPGVWVLGDTADDDRKHGMGIAVEYAGHKGKPIWLAPKPFRWDYTRFGTKTTPAAPDDTLDLTFAKDNAAADGFNLWTINGKSFSMEDRRQWHDCSAAAATVCECATPVTTSTQSIYTDTPSS